MSSPGPAAAAFAGALVLACLAVLPAAAASDPDSEEQEAQPVEAVAVPYLGETTITAAAPWTFAGCPTAPPGLEIACEAGRLTLAADSYDPAWGEHALAVTLTGPVGSLEVRYRVTLAPPEAPSAEPVSYGFPVASGSTVLVPVVLLAPTCTLCMPGTSRLEVGVVDPVEAGFAAATGTHVVVRTTAGFTGDAVVPVRVVDDAGQSAELELAIRVGPESRDPFGGLHVVVPAETDGATTIDLGALTWPSATVDVDATCSAALVGAVTCAGGVATYLPSATEGGLDQFAVRLVGADGRFALASVTIVPSGATSPVELPGEGLALAPVGSASTASLLVRVPPPADDESSASSGLEGFGRLIPDGGLAG